jgi:hypothetical protein
VRPIKQWPKGRNKVPSYCRIGNKQNQNAALELTGARKQKSNWVNNQIKLLLPEHFNAANHFALLFLAVNNKFLWIMKIKNHACFPNYSAASKLQ